MRRSCSVMSGRVAFVEGVRTPFLMSSTEFRKMKAHDLAREAIKGLLRRTGVEPSQIDYTVMGTVIQE